MSVAPWWISVSGATLAQGDLIPECVVPVIPEDFEPPAGEYGGPYEFEGRLFDVLVVTQSCDLERRAARFVATCPVYLLTDYEQNNSSFAGKGKWELVRQGRVEGLHLLAGQLNPNDNRSALVVDFRQIYSLPIEYLAAHAAGLGDRHRLLSPYLEHFSQAFARFFMRVGLPSGIPQFK